MFEGAGAKDKKKGHRIRPGGVEGGSSSPPALDCFSGYINPRVWDSVQKICHCIKR